jgi:hypothetical protein
MVIVRAATSTKGAAAYEKGGLEIIARYGSKIA